MEIDTSPALSNSRKRSSQALDNDEDKNDVDANSQRVYRGVKSSSLSRKRIRSEGIILPTPQLIFNTHDLLNSLAFVRLHVTSNFSRYNPRNSVCVILCPSLGVLENLYPPLAEIKDPSLSSEEAGSSDYWHLYAQLRCAEPLLTLSLHLILLDSNALRT